MLTLQDLPSDVLRYYLVGKNLIGLPGSTSPITWPSFVGPFPDNVDNCLSLLDTTSIREGSLLQTGEVIEHHGVQLLLRCISHRDGMKLMTKLSATIDRDTFANVVDVPGGGRYVIQKVTRVSGPVYLGQEKEKQRRLFSMNTTMTLQDYDPFL